MKILFHPEQFTIVQDFFYYTKEVRVHGTGSCPCPPHGLHLAILFTVSHKPFIGPYFLKASIPYCEQVGVNLHCGPSHGEMISWYNFIKRIKG